MLNHASVYLDAIVVGDRMRQVDEERVATLAKSMAAIGLQQPISVWAEKDAIEGAPDTLHLVAGLHRLRAAESLGWEQIDAVLVDMDEIDRKLWEIAENLHRSELTAKERAEQIAEWVKLAEEKRKREAEKLRQVGAVSNGKGGRGNQEGVRAAARELGMKETNVRRAVKIAGMSNEAKQAAEQAGLADNQSALERIARADDQLAEVEKIRKERTERPPRLSEPEVDPRLRRPSKVDAAQDDVSWTDSGEPSKAQLKAVRSLNDAELCAFLLKVEGLGLMPALRSLARAA